AVGWDYSLKSAVFPLTVGTTQCAPPTKPGVNVCSPLNDSMVNSPVLVYARGAVNGTILRMEVWVDGVKKFSTFGTNTLKTTLSLGPGELRFTYFIVNTVGQKWSQTVHASVP